MLVQTPIDAEIALHIIQTQMKKIVLICFGAMVALAANAQVTFPQNDVADERSDSYLFTNATVHVDGNTVIENGEVYIIKDRIKKVGRNVSVPNGVIKVDLKRKHIYPSFIDPYSSYGMPKVERPKRGSYYNTVLDSDKKGAFAWNAALKPENNAKDLFTIDKKQAEILRKAGFGAVITNAQDGIIRGTSALVSLADELENNSLIKSTIAANYSLDKGSSPQSYPISMMGAVALLRQTFYDADWYKKGGMKKERNNSLEAFNAALSLPQVFETTDVLAILRADNIGDEFSKQFIFVGNGDEYQRLPEVKRTNGKLILPLNFPELKDVEDPYDAQLVSLRELKHWEMAPANYVKVYNEGIQFAITADKLKKPEDLLKNLRKAVEYGLPKEVALNAITSIPAELYNITDLGKIKVDYLANFLITDKDVFEKDVIMYENWIQGKAFVLENKDALNLTGNYKMTVGDSTYLLAVKGSSLKPSFELMKQDSSKVVVNINNSGDLLSIGIKEDNGTTRLSGYVDGTSFTGKGVSFDGKEVTFSAVRVSDIDKKEEEKTDKETPKIGDVIYPFQAYGSKELPKQENMLIRNATVWTNESEGIIQNADVLVNNGKISAVGKNLSAADATTVDGTGMHLTSGIIDEHTHIALFSVNEIESVSAEVRQSDVVDSEDIDIYRQLAGGVTAAQQLHGSADCIGGQSSLIKFRWGQAPEGLKIQDADGFIKFALGENVKRGNAPSTPNRYPATRMGVEQVIRDAFLRAKAYEKSWKEYNGLRNKDGVTPPRKDLELDTVLEILNGERFITCHSYIQSEINMLMKVADDMGFRVNTFTHILEGYKVADKMKAHGANGSTFSDWWAYKMEVKEAIPYNAALMAKVGVNVAINSDDAEMARRLNQEAAKTVLYGGMSEEEAWKMVTLNPAKMLHLDKRMGSIKSGKDADLVLWTANPLSVYARPVKTIVDGTVYFDVEKDKKMTTEVASERNRIIQKMIDEKKGGAAAKKPVKKVKPDVHCDSILEFGGVSIENLDMILKISK
ncbi:MAG: imidazolonepropionase-like amidohydrolase [Spirosomataceae bacterium]|jgi:imidazolonepropionase-like amidohydrolase